uniref:Uncharacterized protein n=1 Tax=Zea mays TaxID=4577 RepID=B4FM41_MAIZE|nr:unknown [Zea mays]
MFTAFDTHVNDVCHAWVPELRLVEQRTSCRPNKFI